MATTLIFAICSAFSVSMLSMLNAPLIRIDSILLHRLSQVSNFNKVFDLTYSPFRMLDHDVHNHFHAILIVIPSGYPRLL